MTDRTPGGLPPDLPPEYAEAYRRGYARAWASSPEEPAPDPSPQPTVPPQPTPPQPEPKPEPPQPELPQPEPAPEAEAFAEREPMSSYDDLFADVVGEPWSGPTHREGEPRTGRPGWLVPALLGAMVLVLIVGAYGLGKVFSGSVDSGPSSDDQLQMPDESAAKPTKSSSEKLWNGDVNPVTVASAASSCVLPPGTDAAGRRVRYTPDRAIDGDFTTAWRCSGDGKGVTIRLDLEEPVRLGEVALVPGYAKTDAQSHADRYAENNRITRVRWTFGDGHSVVQRLDGSTGNRSLQSRRIEPVTTDSVTIEVLDSVRGPRNTIAISEIELSETVS